MFLLTITKEYSSGCSCCHESYTTHVGLFTTEQKALDHANKLKEQEKIGVSLYSNMKLYDLDFNIEELEIFE